MQSLVGLAVASATPKLFGNSNDSDLLLMPLPLMSPNVSFLDKPKALETGCLVYFEIPKYDRYVAHDVWSRVDIRYASKKYNKLWHRYNYAEASGIYDRIYDICCKTHGLTGYDIPIYYDALCQDGDGDYVVKMLERENTLRKWVNDDCFRCSLDGLRFAEDCGFVIGSYYERACNGEGIYPIEDSERIVPVETISRDYEDDLCFFFKSLGFKI